MKNQWRAWSTKYARCAPAALLAVLSGCVFHQLKQNLRQIESYGVLRGSVSVEDVTDAPLVVLVYSGEAGTARVVDAFVLTQPGSFYFMLPAGTYRLAAFEDRSRSFAYDPAHDPAVRFAAGAPLTLAEGQVIDQLRLVFHAGSTERLGFAYTVPEAGRRGAHQLPDISVGVVTTLDDPRFSRENARRGLWQPVDFLFDVGAGIYFLEPFDDEKIPVLFIHGALGTPEGWRPIIEQLDRTRFQPWFVYYPTALPLDLIGAGIHRWMQRLHSTYRFSRLPVVAYSMGGLVGRAFVNDAIQNADGRLADTLRLFVTLSTPWQGHSMAALGVQRAPAVAPSWYDMAPGSPFLRAVQAQPLPAKIPYYLLFSYGGGSRLLREANDGVVTLASELDPGAQQEAVKVFGFDESHTGMLSSSRVSALVNGLVAAAAD